MFKPMAETVILALLASLLLCLTWIPALASVVLRREARAGDTWLVRRIRGPYQPALAWCERHPWIVTASALALFAGSVLVARTLGGEFIPQLEEGSLVVTSQRLPSVALPTSLAAVTLIERTLLLVSRRGDGGQQHRHRGDPHRPDGRGADRQLRDAQAARAVEDRAHAGGAGGGLLQGAGGVGARPELHLEPAGADAHGRPAGGRAHRGGDRGLRAGPRHARRPRQPGGARGGRRARVPPTPRRSRSATCRSCTSTSTGPPRHATASMPRTCSTWSRRSAGMSAARW